MHSQSVKTRLAFIRPAVQQLPVQNPQVEFRSRGGGRESLYACKKKATCIYQIFKIREVTDSLQAPDGCFLLSIKPFA